MSWQDIVFTIGQFMFIIALIPTVKGKDKPAFSTSLISSVFLYVFSLTYVSLSLWGSATTSSILATGWGVLAVQKYLIDKRKSA